MYSPPSRPNSDRHDPGSLVVLLLLLPTSHATLARDSTLDLFVYRTARSNPQCANSLFPTPLHYTSEREQSLCSAILKVLCTKTSSGNTVASRTLTLNATTTTTPQIR